MEGILDHSSKTLQHSAEGVYFVDREGQIVFWNKAAERITGFSAEEVIGRRCAANLLMHVDEGGNGLCKKLCPLAATLKDGTSREAEVFLHHKNGHRVPVLLRVKPMKDERGSVVGGIQFFQTRAP